MKTKDIEIGGEYAVGSARDDGYSQRRWTRCRVTGTKKVPDYMGNGRTELTVEWYDRGNWRAAKTTTAAARVRCPWSQHRAWVEEYDRQAAQDAERRRLKQERWTRVARALVALGIDLDETHNDGEWHRNPIAKDLDAMERLVALAERALREVTS